MHANTKNAQKIYIVVAYWTGRNSPLTHSITLMYAGGPMCTLHLNTFY
jgi:hypothetical protein